MMFIVDGTGEDSDELYEKSMAGGFCKQLEKHCRGLYWRGPTLLGTEVPALAAEVTEAVLAWKRIARKGSKLFLAGHSRGGAAVIYAAQDLRERGIDVDAMFLFDAVDRVFDWRRPLRKADEIPGNVRHCVHALRDTSLAFQYSDAALAARDDVARLAGLPTGRRPSAVEDALDLLMASPPNQASFIAAVRRARELADQDARMKYVMRSMTMKTPAGWTVDFGNCGIDAEPPCKLLSERFLGSHGALGGAPIVDDRAPRGLVESDRAAIASVKSWMWGHLARHGALVEDA
jgi:pimeloyl-ACP methyl ester carboxylesterase